jgi:hypothetical protein
MQILMLQCRLPLQPFSNALRRGNYRAAVQQKCRVSDYALAVEGMSREYACGIASVTLGCM